MQAKESNSENKINIYELGYLLVPTIKEEDFGVVYGNLKELVTSFGGEIIADDMPKMTNLAFSMQKVTSNVRSKFDTAYFGWIKFAMETEKVSELKKRLDLDPNFIRFLILKTVRENTIAQKRFVRLETYKRSKDKRPEEETKKTINKKKIKKKTY